MNYTAHYAKLISRAQLRNYEGHIERHHIIPKCAGGSNEVTNLANLTPEEHYTAHLLLVKIYENNKVVYKKLLHACRLMSGYSNIGRKNKLYGWVKRKLRQERLGSKQTQSTRDKISSKVLAYYAAHASHLKGTILSDNHKTKCAASLSGRVFTEEHKDKISNALKGKPKSEIHKAKFQGKLNPAYIEVSQQLASEIVSDYMFGMRILSICSKFNFSESKIISVLLENNIDIHLRTCPHCNKVGQTSNMIRWHFSNCKVLVTTY